MAEKTQIRSFYYPHERYYTEIEGPSRTKQSFKEECEIKNIIARNQATGLVTHVNKHGPTYGDSPPYGDFVEAMNLVTDAQSMFEELPSGMRTRFRNDPGIFLEFLEDPANHEELVEMGMATPTPAAEAESAPAGDKPPAEPVSPAGDTPEPE